MSEESKPKPEDHPRQVYQTPGNVLADEKLTKAQKIELLEYWELDLEAKLRAESEGMGAPPEDGGENEAKLAEEQRKVSKALNEVRGE